MSDFRNGHIITFYSYKGGTGRTMALANTAWILASNGHRVLVVDWDLESPGLHKFFRPFLDGGMISGTAGVIDLIKDFAWAATRPDPRPADWHTRYASVGRHVVSVEWPHFPDGGSLDFLPAGRQNRDYSSLVSTFDWDNFYERLGGGQFLDALRVDMRRGYDYVLIDSRTGLSDIADICTVHFPDTVVTCFTLSDQSIEGAARVAGEIAERFPDRDIRILPIPMRVDDAEKEKLDAGRAFARSQFEGFPSGVAHEHAGNYWGAVEIPYKPFYAYEETLATFGDAPGSPGSLLAAYERLTGVITGGRVSSLPPLDEDLRLSCRERFVRRRPSLSNEVALSYVPEDRLWAEWIAAVLTQAGIRVRTQVGDRDGDGQGRAPDPTVRTVALMSPAYLRSSRARDAWHAAEGPAALSLGLLPVRVSDVRVPPSYADPPALDLFRLDEQHAAGALLRALDRPAGAETGTQGGTPRYPGIQPAILNLPTRNAAFTGRGEVLERLRDQLVGGSQAVVTQVQEGRTQALFGLGGVGKTQLAIEYAHRFMSDYDVVWWVSAEQPELLNGSMADLADRLGIRTGDNLAEAALAAKDALRRGEPYARWLLIFDNANNAEDVQTYLPGGSGHVLITSRSQTWSLIAKPLEIDVFTREESLEHLRRRVADLSDDDADRVAAALGDLPLAIEQAGAWLQETGMSVDEYVDKLFKQPVRTLALGDSPTYPTPVAATWNVSFQRLREKSPAAVRLLQLLAFFAAEPVSLSMLYGDETVRCLVPYDDSLREKIMIGRLVRELNRFALAKVDQRNNSVQVHRLVQAVLSDQMDADERERTVHEVHRILLGARPREGDTDDPGNWPRYDEIWPHLAPSNAEDCDEEQTRQLLIDRVRYLWRRGEFDRALDLGRRLEALWIRKLGDYDRQTLYLRFHMGNVLRSQGRYRESCELNRAVLDDQRRVLSDPHPHTLQTAGSLAADLRALGELTESLRMEQETYERTKELFFDDHPRVLMAANNLAVALRHVGDFTAARQLDQETADKRREVLGPAHPFTLLSETNLGLDMREGGEFAKSADLLRETLNTYAEVPGPDLPDTLHTARSLAISLREAGRLAEARQLIEATYERYLQRFGPHSPDTVACKLNLACDLMAAGERRGALELASEVRASYQDTLGADNPYTLIAANNITVYLRHLGDSAESRALGVRTLRSLRRKVGPDHPFSLACAVNVANTLGELQEYAEAEKLQRDTLDRLRAVLGPYHPTTLICEADLAVTLRDLRRTDEARVLREPLLVQLRRILGETHPVIEAVLEWRRVDRELEPLPW
ncbi:FxSxx-COOH system tetratricopeptide repeat protein [Microbispora sp. H10885]|uniref:FxSxx-COOH system tetratricopeptide repeat protein n=1 Tax=Microbispora sp. H10885 TaxID=2729110 RepID=UPI001604415F|nr:FxSxx-COOH system tetratricopeptide repeat protein [Microbispora sp. H10885]